MNIILGCMKFGEKNRTIAIKVVTTINLPVHTM